MRLFGWRQPKPGRELRQANEALRKHDYATAIGLYKAMLEEDPDNVALLLNLGTALHLTGQHTPAIQRFERVLELDPSQVPALINMAAAHGALGHVDKAIQILARALEIDATKRDLHYNLAALYARKGLLPNAMAELELELAMHPDHALAAKTLAELRREYLG
ncbi:MAG: tetratricopeptide repeat protein [Armatimonadota bacterium]